MKIGSSDEIIKQAGFDMSKKVDAETGPKFGEILNSAMDRSLTSESEAFSTHAASGTPSLGINPITRVARPLPVDRVDALVDLMDEYQQQLGDSRFSLKDMDPLVRKMETETEKLMTDARSLDETDDLKAILDQALITASFEIARFNRGDYISLEK